MLNKLKKTNQSSSYFKKYPLRNPSFSSTLLNLNL